MFYRTVAQSVLLFGLETWVFSAVMERKVEGTHMGYLRLITGKRGRWKSDKIWDTPSSKLVWEEAGTHLVTTYIGRRLGTVVQWVSLRKFFEVCAEEKGYEGGRT